MRLAVLIHAAAFAAAVLALPPAAAEESVRNPLRPKAEESRKAGAGETKREEKKAEATKPRRERSAKQKQNDEMMRACGTEWRAEKAALQAKGETWRSFLKDCRAKKKSETPV
jgi:hypothetical protein